MTKTFVVSASVSAGTGTTKTQIPGTGTDIIVPQNMNFIQGAVPYMAATAAYTAAESTEKTFFLESTDINPNIAPKRWGQPTQIGGLSSPFQVTAPLLDYIPVNIPCSGQNKLQAFVQSMTADTAAMRMGVGLNYHSQGNGKPQIYYDVPFASGNPNSTSTGTGAARVALTSITTQQMMRVLGVYMRVYPGTITSSESYIGFMEFISDGWEAAPLTAPIQPIATGVTAGALGVGIPGDVTYGVNPYGFRDTIERVFKDKTTNTITIFYNQEEALTAAGTASAGVVMVKQ